MSPPAASNSTAVTTPPTPVNGTLPVQQPAVAAQAPDAVVTDAVEEQEDLDVLARRVVELEKAAAEMHFAAQRFNKEGRFAEAQAAYSQMHDLEDQASALAKKVGCVQCVLGTATGGSGEAGAGQLPSICTIDSAVLEQYAQLYRPSSWEQAAAAAAGRRQTAVTPGAESGTAATGSMSSAAEEVMQRAMGAVVGGAVADAAATGVHWVYDLDLLRQVEAEMRAAAGLSATPQQGAGSQGPPVLREDLGLEFLDPPRSPFYSYAVGRNSPYGEQTAVLLSSLAQRGGLDCSDYADRLAAYFGQGFVGYRDVSTKGFLRNHERGLVPPLTGADDAQANCTARLAPLVALFAGDPHLYQRVEMATRVTQATDAACAWGCAGASVLEGLVLGLGSPKQLVQQLVQELRSEAAAGMEGGQASCNESGAYERGTLTADGGVGAVAASGAHPGRFGGLWGMAGQVADELDKALQLRGSCPEEAIAQLGRNCHMPNALTSPLQVLLYVEHCMEKAGPVSAPKDATAATQEAAEAEQVSQRGSSFQAWYKLGVRLALREGGCCASRAAYVGACLGAWLGGMGAVPIVWLGRYQLMGELQEALPLLCGSRKGSWVVDRH